MFLTLAEDPIDGLDEAEITAALNILSILLDKEGLYFVFLSLH